MREKTSRPYWSVPKGWAPPGLASIAEKSIASGSNGAISAAPKANATYTAMISSPTDPSGWLLMNCSAALPRLGSARSAGAGVVATMAMAAAAHSAQADARIEPAIEQVDQQVEED